MADNDHAANLSSQEDGRKIIVPDTNVSVNFSRALESSFDDNYVIVPEVSMDELDSFKREKDSGRGQSAREALRMFEQLSEKGDLRRGVALANGGMLYVFPRIGERDFFGMGYNPDNEIIATALLFQKANPDRSVVVISDDKRVLVKARYFGLHAEPYSPKTPLNTSVLFEEEETILLNKDQYQLLNERNYIELEADYLPNHVYGVRSLTAPDSFEECFTACDRRTLKRIKPGKCRSLLAGIRLNDVRSRAAIEALFDPTIHLMCLLGKAGTGKTLLSLAAALQQVAQGLYEEIIIARVPVPVGGRDTMGFLPGTMEEKQRPWLDPIFDDLWHLLKANRDRAGWPPLQDIMSQYGKNRAKALEAAMEKFCISMTSFDHLQGRTFADAFVIVDEGQNMQMHKTKMVLTRPGRNVKLVFNGDILLEAVGPFSGSASNSLSLLAAAAVDQPVASVIELRDVKREVLAELMPILRKLSY